MRQGMLLAALAGTGLALWLVFANDAGAVLHAFATVGFGLAGMVLVRLAILGCCGAAWASLVPGAAAPPVMAFQQVRFVREAVNVMLPVATVGGDILGARLITFWGLPGGIATASVLVDLLLQATGQAVFTLLGVALLAQVAGAEAMVEYALAGLGVAALGLLGFFLAQRHGVRFIERAAARLIARLARNSERGGQTLGVHEGLHGIWGRRAGVGRSFVLHVLAWLLGVLEIWIAMRCMGLPGSLAEAAIIESLSQALRGAAFPVPAGLGVQEGGYVVLGHVLGIGPEAAVALSLAKRVPDMVLGLPGLALWHWLERRRAAPATGAGEG